MRPRLLAPIALVAFVAALGLSFFASVPARAVPSPPNPTFPSQGPNPSQAATTAPLQPHQEGSPSLSPSTTARTKTGSSTTFPPPVNGGVTTTQVPALVPTTLTPSVPTTISLAGADLDLGRTLFQANCASCHGVNAQGSYRAPNLVGVGAATVDFWVRTGRMPLAYPTAQAVQKPPRFDNREILAIDRYVTSLGPGGPGIPALDLPAANLASGEELYSTNCAPCHVITGVGDALSNGLNAPTLYGVTPVAIAEAMRTGPGNMPRFGPNQFSAQDINDVVLYVHNGDIQRPDDKGGNGIGHIGPVTEGFVAIFGGLGAILLVSYWIGDRAG